MDAPLFSVEFVRLESGRYVQRIVFRGTTPESALIVATVDEEWPATSMARSLNAMLQRIHEAGREAAAGDSP